MRKANAFQKGQAKDEGDGKALAARLLSVALFGVLALILLFLGTKKSPELSADRKRPPDS
jgi:hypothetical protein